MLRSILKDACQHCGSKHSNVFKCYINGFTLRGQNLIYEKILRWFWKKSVWHISRRCVLLANIWNERICLIVNGNIVIKLTDSLVELCEIRHWYGAFRAFDFWRFAKNSCLHLRNVFDFHNCGPLKKTAANLFICLGLLKIKQPHKRQIQTETKHSKQKKPQHLSPLKEQMLCAIESPITIHIWLRDNKWFFTCCSPNKFSHIIVSISFHFERTKKTVPYFVMKMHILLSDTKTERPFNELLENENRWNIQIIHSILYSKTGLEKEKERQITD